MKIDYTQKLMDCAVAELAGAFLESHAESNGIEFCTSNQLNALLNVVMSELDSRNALPGSFDNL